MKGTFQMSQSAPQNTPLLNDRTYNVLKHVAAVGLPALTTLYFALAQIWHFPDTSEVMGTISAINMFIGGLVGVSTVQYKNSDSKYVGDLEVVDTGDKKTFSLSLNGDPAELENMTEATFKVTQLPPVQAAPQNLPQPGA